MFIEAEVDGQADNQTSKQLQEAWYSNDNQLIDISIYTRRIEHYVTNWNTCKYIVNHWTLSQNIPNKQLGIIS